MLTYQDLLKTGPDEKSRMAFVRKVIGQHTSSNLYRTAVIADSYDRGRNVSILEYEKTLVNVLGQIVPDRFSPNHKATSNFFNIFTTQLSQYLLGNGVKWKNPETKKKLGDDSDTQFARLGHAALVDGVAFGFYNNGRVQVFPVTQFAPLYDEENGSLRAGVRFWQLDADKPLRATLYETDGYTEYIWPTREDAARQEDGKVLQEKRAYILRVIGDKKDREDGTEIYEGLNYPDFPIVPLWANPQHQSELVPLREKIDAYDLILSGYANDLDSAQLYWILKGADGMDQMAQRLFLQQLHTSKVATVGDGQEVQAVTVDIPFEARQNLLTQLENRLYKDAQALDPRTISGGAATATQIRAAYEPLNTKCDQFEYCVIDFLNGILHVAGLEDKPTFVRSMVMNIQEEIQSLVMAGDYLSSDYITRRILMVLGDGDHADEVLEELEAQMAEQETDDTDSGDMEAFYADVEETLNSFLGGDSDGRDSGTETTPVSA